MLWHSTPPPPPPPPPSQFMPHNRIKSLNGCTAHSKYVQTASWTAAHTFCADACPRGLLPTYGDPRRCGGVMVRGNAGLYSASTHCPRSKASLSITSTSSRRTCDSGGTSSFALRMCDRMHWSTPPCKCKPSPDVRRKQTALTQRYRPPCGHETLHQRRRGLKDFRVAGLELRRHAVHHHTRAAVQDQHMPKHHRLPFII